MKARHTRGPGNHGYLRGGRCPPEYRIWGTMIQRCCNPRCREYRNYGGRGITVCPRWLEANGFAHFLADVGPQPFPRASLNRLNNHGNYEPGNVVWADQRTQMRNTRRNRLLTHGGKTMTLVEWAEALGMLPVTLGQRLFKGWSVQRALTTPVEPRRPYAQWTRRNPNPRKPGRKPRTTASAQDDVRASAEGAQLPPADQEQGGSGQPASDLLRWDVDLPRPCCPAPGWSGWPV